MTRRMSCALTVDAVRARTKTVTRRSVDTWADLEAGDRLTLIEKGMGLRKGEKQVVLAEVEIVSNTVQPLTMVTTAECAAEGFPHMTPLEFAVFWAQSHGYGSYILLEGQSPLVQVKDPYVGVFVRHDGRKWVNPFGIHTRITDYHGNGAARPVDRELGTVDTRDRHALVHPSIDVNDCGFRMLTPAEIGRAQAFPDTYRVAGPARDKVRQYGNAVSPPAATLLAERILEAMS